MLYHVNILFYVLGIPKGKLCSSHFIDNKPNLNEKLSFLENGKSLKTKPDLAYPAPNPPHRQHVPLLPTPYWSFPKYYCVFTSGSKLNRQL